MKTLTVENNQYELRAVFNEKFIAFSMCRKDNDRDRISHSLRRSLAEKIPVQVSIKNYLKEQHAVVSYLLSNYRFLASSHFDSNGETCSQFSDDLVWQDFMLETALSLAEQAIAYYGEE